MKRILTIAVLICYLFSFTEIGEFLKLPLLFEHYTEHASLDKTISFGDFLGMHYNSNHHAEKENDADRNLPFKSHDNCTVFASVNFFIQNTSIQIKAFEIEINEHKSQEKEFFFSSFSSNIWQPPKA